MQTSDDEYKFYIHVFALLDDDGSKYPQVRIRRATQNIEITGENAIIATGSRPNRPAVNKNGVALPFTKNKFIDATGIDSDVSFMDSVASPYKTIA